MRRSYRAVARYAAPSVLFVLSAASLAQAQVFTSAYRVLGQAGFQQNGLNMVQGVELSSPSAVALDLRGGQLHLYVADTINNRVLGWADAKSYQIGDPPGILLGQPSRQFTGTLGIGIKGFTSPLGLAVDPTTGNLYVADFGNNRVLRFPSPFANPNRVEPDAVYGQASFATNGAGVSKSALNKPRSVAVDSGGNLFVSDSGNNRIIRFPAAVLNSPTAPEADIVIGQPDFFSSTANSGGGAVPAGNTFDTPVGLSFDAQDNLYVADYNNARVLKFARLAGPSTQNPLAAAVWGQADFKTRVLPPQPTSSSLAGPQGVSVDSSGNLYVAVPSDNRILVFPSATSGSNATSVIGQPDFVTIKSNTAAWPRASANTLSSPRDVRTAPDGTVFAADTGNNRVLSFAPGSKSAALVWGQNDFSHNGPNQIKPGSINAAYKMAIDYSATPFVLYVSDSNNHRVLAWRDSVHFRNGDPADFVIGQPDLFSAYPNADTAGSIAPSPTSLNTPTGIVVDQHDGTLYVSDAGNHRVLRYRRPASQSGRVSPDAVIGQVNFTTAVSALVSASSLRNPGGLALGPDGDLFVADTGNNRVLEFAANSGTGASAIRVYGQPNMSSSSRPALTSPQTLATPQGIFVDAAFSLYVADTGENRVVIFPNTQTAPSAGMPAAFVLGPASFTTSASFLGAPTDVVLDSNLNVYVADFADNRVLVFPSLVFLPATGAAPNAVVGQADFKTVGPNYNSSNGLATAEGLYGPLGLYLDRKDTLYVGDSGNNRVLHFLKSAATVNAATYQAGAAIAQGALVTLFGSGLADEKVTITSAPWPTAAAQREVVVNDELKAPIFFINQTQVNFQAPQSAPVGNARVAVRVADTGELIAGGSVIVASASPGLFTGTQDGKGQAAAVNQDGRLNSSINPVARGSIVTLFGTGQGQVSPPVPDGQAAPTSPLSNTVTVATTDARTCTATQPSMCVAIGTTFGEIQFSGLAPGFVSLWQINVKVPLDAPTGAAVPVRVLIDGVPSNVVAVAIR